MNLDLKNEDFKKQVIEGTDNYERITNQIKEDLGALHTDILSDFNETTNNNVSVDIGPAKQFLGGLKDKTRNEIKAEDASWAFAIQLVLKQLKGTDGTSYYKGKVDGLYGGGKGETRTAVKAFQTKWNDTHTTDKITDDGRAGPDTIKKILAELDGVTDTKESSNDGKEIIISNVKALPINTNITFNEKTGDFNYSGTVKNIKDFQFDRTDGAEVGFNKNKIESWENEENDKDKKFQDIIDDNNAIETELNPPDLGSIIYDEDNNVYRYGSKEKHRKEINNAADLATWKEEFDVPDNFTGNGIKRFDDGSIYEGDLVDGGMNGNGIYTWKDGDTYEGMRVDSKRTGKGTYTWESSKNVYKGKFINNQITGEGTIKYHATGDVYTGAFVDGRRTGTGTMKYNATGDVYTGAFVDGEKTGEGIMSYNSGNSYDGNWEDNQKHGVGIYTWKKTGNAYVGEFRNDKRTGNGTFTWEETGNSYIGKFVDGEMTGNGRMTDHVTGNVYNGEFINGIYIDNIDGFNKVYNSLNGLGKNFINGYDIDSKYNIKLLNNGLEEDIFDPHKTVFHSDNKDNFEVDGTGDWDSTYQDYKFNSVENFFTRLEKKLADKAK